MSTPNFTRAFYSQKYDLNSAIISLVLRNLASQKWFQTLQCMMKYSILIGSQISNPFSHKLVLPITSKSTVKLMVGQITQQNLIEPFQNKSCPHEGQIMNQKDTNSGLIVSFLYTVKVWTFDKNHSIMLLIKCQFLPFKINERMFFFLFPNWFI